MRRDEVIFRNKKTVVFRGNIVLPKDSVVEVKVKIPDDQGGYTEETIISETLISDGQLLIRGFSIVEDNESGG